MPWNKISPLWYLRGEYIRYIQIHKNFQLMLLWAWMCKISKWDGDKSDLGIIHI